MKTIKTLAFFALIILTTVACKKEDEAVEFEGSLTISAPAANDTIHGGTTFPITGTVTGNVEMHGYQVTVYNQTDQTVIYSSTEENHASEYSIQQTVNHTLTIGTPLRLVVEVEVDHDSAPMTKEVLFYFKP